MKIKWIIDVNVSHPSKRDSGQHQMSDSEWKMTRERATRHCISRAHVCTHHEEWCPRAECTTSARTSVIGSFPPRKLSRGYYFPCKQPRGVVKMGYAFFMRYRCRWCELRGDGLREKILQPVGGVGVEWYGAYFVFFLTCVLAWMKKNLSKSEIDIKVLFHSVKRASFCKKKKKTKNSKNVD